MTSRRDRILSSEGAPEFFVSAHALRDVDLTDARVRSGPFRLPRVLGRARLKEWQHFMLATPEVLITLAVVDVKYLKLGWIQVVDLATGTRVEHRRQMVAADVGIARALWDDHTWFRTRGFRIEIHSHLDAGEHVVTVEADASAEGPAIKGQWRCAHDPEAVRSTVVSMPVGRGRAAYSHKAALPARGAALVGDRSYDFGDRGVAVLDVHKAHYPRKMFWRWATCAGYLPDGRLVGFNLTKNVVEDDERWNENAVWCDGDVRRVGAATFTYDTADLRQPWHVRSSEGDIDLVFSPEGGRGENTNVPGLARSRFEQLYGTFSGTMRFGNETLSVDAMRGLCEEHDSIW